jgi:hypothetical protein
MPGFVAGGLRRLRRKKLVGYLLVMAVLTWAFTQINPNASVI